MLKFTCPECGSNELIEEEIGSYVQFEIDGVNEDSGRVVYKRSYTVRDAVNRWFCGGCRKSLPITHHIDLISYLRRYCNGN